MRISRVNNYGQRRTSEIHVRKAITYARVFARRNWFLRVSISAGHPPHFANTVPSSVARNTTVRDDISARRHSSVGYFVGPRPIFVPITHGVNKIVRPDTGFGFGVTERVPGIGSLSVTNHTQLWTTALLRRYSLIIPR